jgi:hypothetical protein
MTSYVVSDFNFNLGETNISQEYVKLFKPDVPWGINTTYIYKENSLTEQFISTNQHLVIENKTLDGNIIFKTQGTGRTIINDLSINLINGQPYIGGGSDGGSNGVSLTPNSINSSHIQDGSILGIDICDGTITTSKIADNTITSRQLTTSLLDRLVSLERPQVNLIIYNLVNSTANIPYTIYLNDGETNTYYFTAFQEIGIGSSHSVLINIPNPSAQIRILINTNNVTIINQNIYSGATLVDATVDSLSFTLNSGYSNIQVYFEVIPVEVIPVEVIPDPITP